MGKDALKRTAVILIAYYAHERLKEIEEGLDDAVDDY